jgi:hypothetical protein
MTWKRRWGIVTALALAQGAIIVGYQGFFSGSAAPAQAPAGEAKVVVTPKKEEGTKEAAPIEVRTLEPAIRPVVQAALPEGGNAAYDVPPPAAGAAPLPVSKVDTGEPPMLPDLNSAKPLPPESPSAKATNPPPLPGSDLVPVNSVEKKGSQDPMPDARGLSDTKGEPSPAPLPGEFTRVYAQAPGTPAPPPNATTPPAPGLVPAGTITPDLGKSTSPAIMPPHGAGLPGPSAPPAVGATPPAPQPQAPEQPKVEAPCPWTLRVEIVKGRTLLTAQTGQEVQFRVSCDTLDLQAPRGNIKAAGNVQVESDGLKGQCEQMSIAWQADQVVLEGNAVVKCQRDGQDMDLKAAKLSLRLSVPAQPSQPKVSVRPGEVRGATFLSRSKSVRGEYRTSRPRPAEGERLQPVPADGGYDRYIGSVPLGSEPPRRGSKSDE